MTHASFVFLQKDSGTTEFSSYTMDSINQNCFEQIKNYEIFHEPSDSQGVSVVQIVGQLVCLNNCSNNGDCIEGMILNHVVIQFDKTKLSTCKNRKIKNRLKHNLFIAYFLCSNDMAFIYRA